MFNALENRIENMNPVKVRQEENQRASSFVNKRLTGKQLIMQDDTVTTNESSDRRFASKQVSNLKAELVRNNVIARADLMRCYRPQLQKQKLLDKNPFYNGKMVAGAQTVEVKNQMGLVGTLAGKRGGSVPRTMSRPIVVNQVLPSNASEAALRLGIGPDKYSTRMSHQTQHTGQSKNSSKL